MSKRKNRNNRNNRNNRKEGSSVGSLEKVVQDSLNKMDQNMEAEESIKAAEQKNRKPARPQGVSMKQMNLGDFDFSSEDPEEKPVTEEQPEAEKAETVSDHSGAESKEDSAVTADESTCEDVNALNGEASRVIEDEGANALNDDASFVIKDGNADVPDSGMSVAFDDEASDAFDGENEDAFDGENEDAFDGENADIFDGGTPDDFDDEDSFDFDDEVSDDLTSEDADDIDMIHAEDDGAGIPADKIEAFLREVRMRKASIDAAASEEEGTVPEDNEADFPEDHAAETLEDDEMGVPNTDAAVIPEDDADGEPEEEQEDLSQGSVSSASDEQSGTVDADVDADADIDAVDESEETEEEQDSEEAHSAKISIEDEEPKPKKKGKAGKIAAILAGMVLVTAGGAYAGVSYYYTDKFFKGTVINGIDCSDLTAMQVEDLIMAKVEDYSIEVDSRNLEPEVIRGDEINYRYQSNGDVSGFLKSQKCYMWPMGYFSPLTYTSGENITFDRTALETKFQELSCTKDENQQSPKDAYITYQTSGFEIVPEDEGSSLILAKAYQLLEDAVGNSADQIDFDAEGTYETAFIKQDNPKLQGALEAYSQYSNASITFDFGDVQEVLDGNTIKNWLVTDSDGSYVKDNDVFREKVTKYVEDLGSRYDTVGEGVTFTATSGREVTVYGMEYGWKINQEAEVEQILSEIENGVTTQREPIYSITAGESRKTAGFGDTYIEVDLGLQHMYYYMDGEIIFDADFISGLPDGVHNTPEGIYYMFNKESPSVLIGQTYNGVPEYVSPVSYWMAFNGGIGFHDATWQTSGFGGQLYYSLGSHGCINLSLDSAATLYQIIRYEDPIICFY